MANLQTIVDSIAAAQGITKKAAEANVRQVLETIIATTVAEGEVKLAGFGSFSVKDVAAKTVRHPATGESLDVPATKKVSFKAAAALKERVKATV